MYAAYSMLYAIFPLSIVDPGLSLPSLIDLGFSHIFGIVCIGHLLRLWNQYLVHPVEWWITAVAVDQMTVQTILTGKIGVNEY